MKSLALQQHGVEPYVDHDLQTSGVEREGVPGPVHLPDGGVARRHDFFTERVDGDPVSSEALGEDGIGDLLQWDYNT